MLVANIGRRSPPVDALFGASRIRSGVDWTWRTVVRYLLTLDKRMTENLDQRARYLLHGDAARSDVKRHEK